MALATVPETTNPVISLRSSGWAVNARQGTLSAGLPLGTIPGEIPVPIVYGVQGTFSVDRYKYLDPDQPTGLNFRLYLSAAVIRPAYGTVHFGFIRNAYTLPDQSVEPSITLLEDGQEYDAAVPFTTAHNGVMLKLPQAYGFTAQGTPKVDNGSTHLFYDTVSTGLSPDAKAKVIAHLPSGFGATSSTYKVVMDTSIARVFASVPALGGWVPVLWVDRFGHSVTFQWTRSTSNLPTGATALTTLAITNNRGRGAQLSWADWSDTTTVHDLVRVDFTNISAPSMLVQGYSGTTSAVPQGFPAYDHSSADGLTVAPPSSTGGPLGRPTDVKIGDPTVVPQPLWQGLVPEPQTLAPSGPSPEPRQWQLSWDLQGESTHAALRSITSPTGLTSTFGLTPYGPASSGQFSGVLGVSQVDDADANASGATHQTTWDRSPLSATLPGSVTIHDSWPSVGASDRQWILTYPTTGVGSAESSPTQTVLADASGNPLVTTNTSLTTVGVAGQDVGASVVTTTYASSLGIPNTQVTYAFADQTNLQISQVTNAVWNGSAYLNVAQSRQTYAPRWDMLDGGDLTSTTLTRYDTAGKAMAPVQTQTRVYDTPASGQVPQLQMVKSYQQIGAWQHGSLIGYDSNGRPASQSVFDSQNGGSTVAPAPNSTTLTYDGTSGTLASALTSYTVPGAANGTQTQSQGGFDANGRPTTFTDAKGVVTTVGYDLLGRVADVAKAGQAPVHITWSSDGLTRTLTQNGHDSVDVTDGYGRPVKQTFPDGRTVETYYDADGRKASQIERAGVITNPATGQAYPARETDWSYDALDRLTSETDPDTVTTNLSYSASGMNTVKDVVNAATGLKVEETDDAFGQAVKRQTFDGATSVKLATYAYDGMGHLIQVVETDPGGVAQTRTFTYDANGRLVSKTEPETGTQLIGAALEGNLPGGGLYNALGQPTSIVEGYIPGITGGDFPRPAQGRTRTLAYDGLGRLVSQTNGADVLSYSFTGAFLTSASTTSNGWTVSQSFGYLPAANGALLQTETTTQPDFTATLQYGYDANGRVASLTYPDGRVASYGYDALSRVNTVNQAPNGASPIAVAGATYDPGWGYRSSLAFASGAQSVWSTQADGIHLKAWSIQLPDGTKLDGDRLYNYDASKDNLSQAGEWSLVHDHLGRLVGASASTLGNYSATYGYDAFDNNTSASVSGNTPPQAIGFTFGALPLNQTPGTTTGGSATGWTYDAAGEATNFAVAPGSSSLTGLSWDGLGRMSQVNGPGLTESEGYAPSGMRVRRDDNISANSRRFVYTSGGLLLAEYVPKAGGGWSWNRDVVYLGSQAIAEVDSNGTHELHSDHLGTPRVITTASGGTSVIEGRQNYGPYGETFPAMDSGYQPLTGYTGHLQTDPTGLIYMRGRFYTPIWHRFVNSDQGADPSTWNQMAYVGGNPMQAMDPTGMMAVTMSCQVTTYYFWDHDTGAYLGSTTVVHDCVLTTSGGDGDNGGGGKLDPCKDKTLSKYLKLLQDMFKNKYNSGNVAGTEIGGFLGSYGFDPWASNGNGAGSMNAAIMAPEGTDLEFHFHPNQFFRSGRMQRGDPQPTYPNDYDIAFSSSLNPNRVPAYVLSSQGIYKMDPQNMYNGDGTKPSDPRNPYGLTQVAGPNWPEVKCP